MNFYRDILREVSSNKPCAFYVCSVYDGSWILERKKGGSDVRAPFPFKNLINGGVRLLTQLSQFNFPLLLKM